MFLSNYSNVSGIAVGTQPEKRVLHSFLSSLKLLKVFLFKK